MYAGMNLKIGEIDALPFYFSYWKGVGIEQNGISKIIDHTKARLFGFDCTNCYLLACLLFAYVAYIY